MEHLLQLRMLIPLTAAMVIGAIALALICKEELKRLSRRGLIVFLCGGGIATVIAQKNMTNGTDGVDAPVCGLMSVFNPPGLIHLMMVLENGTVFRHQVIGRLIVLVETYLMLARILPGGRSGRYLLDTLSYRLCRGG